MLYKSKISASQEAKCDCFLTCSALTQGTVGVLKPVF